VRSFVPQASNIAVHTRHTRAGPGVVYLVAWTLIGRWSGYCCASGSGTARATWRLPSSLITMQPMWPGTHLSPCVRVDPRVDPEVDRLP
jgi:hypothetical protein